MFREMARKKQLISEEECIELLKKEPRGVLSVLGDDDYPYGMPLNHYYCEEDGKIYFHGGKSGHKIDSIKKHNKASFCVYDGCTNKSLVIISVARRCTSHNYGTKVMFRDSSVSA